jgi:MFS family permease
LIVMTCGTLGIVAGGRSADYLAARGRRDATIYVGFLVSLVWFPAGIAIYLMPDPALALVALAIAQFFTSAPFGIAPAAIQQCTPPRLRGQASAVYLFVINLIGLGLGPTAVALTTDFLFHDDLKVGHSLLTVTAAAHAVSCVLLWHGRRAFLATLNRLPA